MELDTPNIQIDGSNLRIAIILPYFNESLGMALLSNTEEELLKNGLKPENIEVIRVAGTLETPFAAKKICEKLKPDAIIALGVIIRGETSHYELVTQTAHQGLMQVQLETGTPIIFGLLGCENLEQAQERIAKNGLNKGRQFAQAALIQTQL